MKLRTLVIRDKDDLDSTLLDLLKDHHNSIQDSMQGGIETLEKSGLGAFDLIVCEYSGTSALLVKCLLDLSGWIPCILLSQTNPLQGHPDLSDCTELVFIKTNEIKDRFVSSIKYFEELGYFTSTPESEFIRFDFRALIETNTLNADVFIKLGGNKYILLWKKGEFFTDSDLAAQTKRRKTQNLYVKKSDFGKLAQKQASALKSLINEQSIDVETSQGVLEDSLEIVQEIVSKVGFSEEVQKIAKKAAALTIRVIGDDPDLSKIMIRLNENQGKYIASHSLMLAEIACAIAHSIGWSSSSTFMKLSLAAILHDVSMTDSRMAKVTYFEEASISGLFTDQELEEIKSHPMKAAEYALQFQDIPPDVDIILQQHHERPKGNGFPRKLFYRQIMPLSSLFIIAHDMLDEFIKTKKQIEPHAFFEKMNDEYDSGTFKKIKMAILKDTKIS